MGWIGVDLDGTLAHYEGWKGIEHIGKPIARMVERVKVWLDEGKDVRIFTARVSGPFGEAREARECIVAWCLDNLGKELPITCKKDFGMVELWDDRCRQVQTNTGRIIEAPKPAKDEDNKAWGRGYDEGHHVGSSECDLTSKQIDDAIIDPEPEEFVGGQFYDAPA